MLNQFLFLMDFKALLKSQVWAVAGSGAGCQSWRGLGALPAHMSNWKEQ